MLPVRCFQQTWWSRTRTTRLLQIWQQVQPVYSTNASSRRRWNENSSISGLTIICVVFVPRGGWLWSMLLYTRSKNGLDSWLLLFTYCRCSLLIVADVEQIGRHVIRTRWHYACVCIVRKSWTNYCWSDCICCCLESRSLDTHIHTRLMALFLGLPRWAGTRKVKPIWILLKQEIVSGSGISWAICKSAPHSRQTTRQYLTTLVFLHLASRSPDNPGQNRIRTSVVWGSLASDFSSNLSWHALVARLA